MFINNQSWYKKILIYLIIIILVFLVLFFLGNNFFDSYNKILAIKELRSSINSINNSLDSGIYYPIPLNNQKFDNKIKDFETSFSSVKLNNKIENQLNNYLSNLYVFQGNFEQGKLLMSGGDWKYFFNLGNINLFDGIDKLQSNGNYELQESYLLFNKSIESYNQSALLLGSGSNYSDLIINNRVAAFGYRFLSAYKICLDLFNDIVNKIKQLVVSIDKLLSLFDEEISLIDKILEKTNRQYLIDCMKDVRKSIIISQINVDYMKQEIVSLNSSSLNLFKEKIEQPEKCADEKSTLLNDVSSTANTMFDIINNHYKNHQSIKDMLQDGSEIFLEEICKIAKETDQEVQYDDELSKQLQKLKDKLQPESEKQENQGQDNTQPNSDEEKGGDEIKDENSSNPNDTLRDYHTDIDEGLLKELLDNIQNQNNNWIQQMEQLKKGGGYNAKEYLNQLFKDFYGNDKDFNNIDKYGEDGEW